MALRDQPYIPLYIQDFLTDEKLIECSAESTGVYIRLMCIMHKSEEYGTILLRQKEQQASQQDYNFAVKLSKYMPYSLETITQAIQELIEEGVIHINGCKLLQKRMIKDNNVSLVRAESGKKGGFATAKKVASATAKKVANSEYEYISENVSVNVVKKRKSFIKPTIEEVKDYCIERGNMVDADKWFDYYESNGWMVGKNKMKNWKAAVRTWEKNSFNKPTEVNTGRYRDLTHYDK